MDTSETYIKMCEKADKIQKGHRLEEPDFIAILETLGGHSIPEYKEWRPNSYCEEYEPYDKPTIWLPRQDQLQEMVRHAGYAGFNGFKYFIKWLQASNGGTYPYFRCQDNEEFPPFTSMEQLWLAFVMKERYSEIWNGADWIKE